MRLWPRRRFLQLSIGAALLKCQTLAAQAQVLPLDTPGLDHLDIIVPDVEASARFYMSLFNTRLHAQPFRGGQRYFVLLGEMNARREVRYLAIGAANGRGTGIGHFCTTVRGWRENSAAIWAAMTRQIAEAGFGSFPGSTGFGGLFDDPDGIEIQFLPSPDTLVTAAVPSDLVPSNQGLVTPLGLDHVLLNVSDLDQALRWYRILYGQESSLSGNLVRFDFPDSLTHILLREPAYGYGSTPGIASFGIKTLPFDQEQVGSLLAELGAADINDVNGSLEFVDIDGLSVVLIPT